MAANHWEIVLNSANIVSDTPQKLFENGINYLKWCDENPIVLSRTLLSGKEAGKKVDIEKVRPYSIKGLCLHCNITEEYLIDVRNFKDKSNDYYVVVTKLMYLIYVHNLEHGMVDEFNSILTGKVLSIDVQEVPTSGVKVEVVNGLPELYDSEIQVLEKLDMEKPGWINEKDQNS